MSEYHNKLSPTDQLGGIKRYVLLNTGGYFVATSDTPEGVAFNHKFDEVVISPSGYVTIAPRLASMRYSKKFEKRYDYIDEKQIGLDILDWYVNVLKSVLLEVKDLDDVTDKRCEDEAPSKGGFGFRCTTEEFNKF